MRLKFALFFCFLGIFSGWPTALQFIRHQWKLNIHCNSYQLELALRSSNEFNNKWVFFVHVFRGIFSGFFIWSFIIWVREYWNIAYNTYIFTDEWMLVVLSYIAVLRPTCSSFFIIEEHFFSCRSSFIFITDHTDPY